MVSTSNSQGQTLNAVTWTLTGVATFFVVLRLVSRTIISRGTAGLDDVLTLFALLVVFAANISTSIAVTAGLGKRISDIPPADQQFALKMLVVTSSIIVWTFTLPKLGIVALLQRLLNMRLRIAVVFWFLSFANIALAFVISVLWFERCRPVAHQWNLGVPGTCSPQTTLVNLGYVASSFSAFLDILFAIYPQFVIAKLNMPTRRKVTCGLALGLGSLACAIAIYKMTQFSDEFASAEDGPTYEVPPTFLWALVETDILLAMASLPTIGPFARLVKRDLGRFCSVLSAKQAAWGSLLGDYYNDSRLSKLEFSKLMSTSNLKSSTSQSRDFQLMDVEPRSKTGKIFRAIDSVTHGRSKDDQKSASSHNPESNRKIWKKVEIEQVHENCNGRDQMDQGEKWVVPLSNHTTSSRSGIPKAERRD